MNAHHPTSSNVRIVIGQTANVNNTAKDKHGKRNLPWQRLVHLYEFGNIWRCRLSFAEIESAVSLSEASGQVRKYTSVGTRCR